MSESATNTSLERGLSLGQATAINMIDMVGIGPFITLPFIVGLMQGPLALLAWLLGALLAYADGFVWAEMGAKWPEAGGSYIFLKKLFGAKWGPFMAFLFIWQTFIQAPLVVASGAIGFSQYLAFLIPIDAWQKKAVSGTLVILLVALLYRNIKSIGKLSVVLWVITGGTLLWLIFSGVGKFSAARAFHWNTEAFSGSTLFMLALGQASLKAVYSYLGYYNVCHLGGEIKQPAKNIPRSIFISITGIAVLYLAMQTVILGVLPWKDIAGSEFIASTYFEAVYNHATAQVATLLILCISLASLFSVLLGYSRIPYAAAVQGDFFAAFGKLHPRHKFPYISLLWLGGLAFAFSLLFKMKEIIIAIITVRILIQFVSQAAGLIAWHIKKPKEERPFKMPFFPIPALVSIAIWLFIFFSNGWVYIAGALGIIASGSLLFGIKTYYAAKRN